jgi:hypothetical protein
VHDWLARLDGRLFRRYPWLRDWAWYAVARIEK